MSRTEDSLEGIAVIGLSGRFPGACSVDQFWRNLRDGVESIYRFTDQELEALGISADVYNHPNYVKAGTILENVDKFDAEFFGFYPKEAEIQEPQHRIFLECAWEALENAGYDVESHKGQIGVFAGCSPNYYGRIIPFDTDPALVAEAYQREMANEKDYLCTLVAYKLGLRGPAITIQTACSTSLVAVCMACQSLMTYQCDVALAGGVCVNTRQRGGYFYQEGLIPSPDGHCRAFDAKAQGTVLSQGAGVVVLKRLSEALTDGDRVRAVIKGFAINNDGSEKVGFTAPSVNGQAEVIAMAQALSGFSPESISYIEAHGTGTPLGDPIEMAALNKVFREYTEKKFFCAVGSLKTNLGHMDAAAGVAGLIKTVLMLESKEIPPSLHFEKPNPEIDFDNSPFYVNTKLRKWIADGSPLRAGVSAFGLGGTNAHVVLEEAPETEPSGSFRPRQLLLLSAKTKQALDAASANLREYLAQNSTVNIADVAYTLQIGRKAFNHRRFIVCEDANDAVQGLKSIDPNRVKTRHVESRAPEVVFMFPGQGAQYVNMGLELCRTESVFQEQIDQCSEILRPHLSFDLRDILYPEKGNTEQLAQQLKQTSIAQPALFSIEYALAKLWMAWGVHPSSMVGHSIGEYVAACLAGTFSLEDALFLVAIRGQLMQELPTGSMVGVRLSEKDIERFLNQRLSLAVVNGPSYCVVSGEREAVKELEGDLEKNNVAFTLLHTSHAFHSNMMDPILGVFMEQARKIDLHSPQIPFLSNLTGTWITSEESMSAGYWAKHLRHTVRFSSCVQELLKDSNRIFLEVGPGQTLSTFVKQHLDGSRRDVVLSSIRHPREDKSDVAVILSTLGDLWLAGVRLDWSGFNKDERRHRVPLPTYPFERKRYWIAAAERRQEAVVSHAGVTKIENILQDLPMEVSESVHMVPGSTQFKNNHVPPRNDVERAVASIWHKLLGVEQIGARDNFFELGGNSLLAAQLIVEIKKIFDKKLRPASLYEAQTVEQLSHLLSDTPSLRHHTSGAGMPYKIILGNLLENREHIIDLWKRNFEGLPEERYRWIYEENPAGPATCLLAKDEGQEAIIGAYALFPRRVYVKGEFYTACCGGDFAVDKEHRVLAPALLLQDAVMSQIRERKFDFHFGVPNKVSEAMDQMLGLTMFDVWRMTKPLKSHYYLKKHFDVPGISMIISRTIDFAAKKVSKETRYKRHDGFTIEILSSFDGRVDKLWQKVLTQLAIIGERSSTYLNWRYFRSPHFEHSVFALSGKGNGDILGYIVFHVVENRTNIDDMLCLDMNETLDFLVSEFLLFQREQGVDSVSISYGGTQLLVKKLQEFGFSIRDTEGKFVVDVPSDSPLLSCLLEKENWYFMPGDNDI